LQYNFRHEFEDVFFGYELLFVSNGDIFKVENPIFEVGPKKIISKQGKKLSVIPEHEPCYA
jgi:hypothetical protein